MTKKTINVVAAAIFNQNQHLFCALRSETMSLPGYWELPGGKIEPNESPGQALIREIKEELSCSITVENHIHTHLHEYEAINVNLIVYSAFINDGEIILKEHESGVWLPTSKIEELNWAPADIPAIKRIASRHR